MFRPSFLFFYPSLLFLFFRRTFARWGLQLPTQKPFDFPNESGPTARPTGTSRQTQFPFFVRIFAGQPFPPFARWPVFHQACVEQGVKRFPAVSRCARPQPVLSPLDHARAERILLNVTHCRPQVFVVQRAGIVTTSENVPTPAVLPVNILGIHQMHRAHDISQVFTILRCHDQMQVIAHQTVRQNSQVFTTGILSQNAEIRPAIVVVQEDILLTIPTLGNVMRNPRTYYSGVSRHDITIMSKADSSAK